MTQTCNPSSGRRGRLACCRQAGSLLRPEFFKALCDPTRLAVLLRLVEHGAPATVSELGGCCPVDLSVVSRHLAVLRGAGIVESERRGKEVLYRMRWGSVVGLLRQMADAIAACCPEPENPSQSEEIRHGA